MIVGAGWAGLAAASRLRAHGVDPLILERGSSVGGAASTHVADGWLLEGGPHALFAGDPVIAAFLGEQAPRVTDLVSAAPGAKHRYILRRGKRVPVPSGPARAIVSRVLPMRAKARILVEPLVPKRRSEGGVLREESVTDFLGRRFGHGIDDLVDAVVSGIFAGDPGRLSAAVALPRAVEAEKRHGSVLKGMICMRGPPRGGLSAPREGMGPWLARLAGAGRLALGRRVVHLVGTGPYRIETLDGRIDAKKVVLAVPPVEAAAILGVSAAPLPEAPVAIVGLGWRDLPEDHPFAGYGVLHPASEGRFTLGALYESSLFPGRAPAGGTLVRAIVGGRRHPGRVDLDDDLLVRRAAADVMASHGLEVDPDWSQVLRPPAIPQPELGQADRLAPLVDAVARRRGVEVAGWGWQGVGIAASVRAGQAAAARVVL